MDRRDTILKEDELKEFVDLKKVKTEI